MRIEVDPVPGTSSSDVARAVVPTAGFVATPFHLPQP
jgi:hypothetical protein